MPSESSQRFWTAVAVGGAASGVLDIAFACTRGALNGFPPSRILQSVAGGLLGRSAYDGGAVTASLGLVLHFLMTGTMAAVFVLAWRRVPLLRSQFLLAGAAYGAGIYLVMNRIVLPFSSFPGPQPPLNATGLLVHMLFVGVPIAWAAKHWDPLRATAP